MKLTPNKIEFDYHGWHCWQNDSTGGWGAILPRKGDRSTWNWSKRLNGNLIMAYSSSAEIPLPRVIPREKYYAPPCQWEEEGEKPTGFRTDCSRFQLWSYSFFWERSDALHVIAFRV
jgi:hypothetical protein